jgi:hypothetical protein
LWGDAVKRPFLASADVDGRKLALADQGADLLSRNLKEGRGLVWREQSVAGIDPRFIEVHFHATRFIDVCSVGA